MPALEPALTDFFLGPHERLSFVIVGANEGIDVLLSGARTRRSWLHSGRGSLEIGRYANWAISVWNVLRTRSTVAAAPSHATYDIPDQKTYLGRSYQDIEEYN